MPTTMPKEFAVTVVPEDWDVGVAKCKNKSYFWGNSCVLAVALEKLDFVRLAYVLQDGRIQIVNKDDDVWRYMADGVGKELVTSFDQSVENTRKYTLRTPRTVVLTMNDWPD